MLTIGFKKMNMKKGIKVLEEIEGNGPVAERGDNIVYNLRAYLSQGDEIPLNALSKKDRVNIKKYHPELINEDNGYEFFNHSIRLGRRDAIAGVEYSLYGMREGGYRKVKVSPHLAYGEKGIPGKIPPNAVITFELWLKTISWKAERCW